MELSMERITLFPVDLEISDAVRVHMAHMKFLVLYPRQCAQLRVHTIIGTCLMGPPSTIQLGAAQLTENDTRSSTACISSQLHDIAHFSICDCSATFPQAFFSQAPNHLHQNCAIFQNWREIFSAVERGSRARNTEVPRRGQCSHMIHQYK
jgi:hypothetical protein